MLPRCGREAATQGFVPVMGAGAEADEVAVDGSPDPLLAVAAAPAFVDGILTVRMIACVDGEHFDPNSSEILPGSLNWGKKSGVILRDCTVTVQFYPRFLVRSSNPMIMG